MSELDDFLSMVVNDCVNGPRPVTVRTWVEVGPGHQSIRCWRGECTCGWTGPTRFTSTEALDDAHNCEVAGE